MIRSTWTRGSFVMMASGNGGFDRPLSCSSLVACNSAVRSASAKVRGRIGMMSRTYVISEVI